MLAALMLSQALLVRASITDSVELQRFWVFWPSVRMMMTLSRSAAGGGALNGATGEIIWNPQARPMVTLVLPVGVIWSILEFNAVQSDESGIAAVGQLAAWWARNSVAGEPGTVAVFDTSLFWSRSLTQPFQVLWGSGVQILLCDWHVLFVV